jgi:mono/diheme cytochrome c family protein
MAHKKLYAAAALAALTLAAPAFAHQAAAPKLIGKAAAGKSLFTTTCGVCHTLKEAATVGNIGPNLDKAAAPLTEATIIKAITNGGSTVMTKAAVAKYTTQMVAYKGTLTPAQIDDIAAFVYTSTHK